MAEKLRRVESLDIAEDPGLQRRAYRMRQVAVVVIALVLLAALLGAFGEGPLSEADATAEQGSMQLHYERFVRLQSPTELQIELRGGEGKTDLAISRRFLESFRIEGYSPEPDSVTGLPDRLVFTFDQQPPSQVTLYGEPQEIGRQRGFISGPGGDELRFTQWVYP